MKVWQDKPVVIMSATPGGRAWVLNGQSEIMPFFGGKLKGSVGIGNWSDAWDDDTKTLTRTEDIEDSFK